MNGVYNGIMGLIVGDALGVPVKFKERDTYKTDDMMGYGTYNQPPGTWSDDSSLTLATLDSLVRLRKIDPADIMENFCKWLYKAEFTPYNEVFDVEGTTRRAIERYKDGTAPLNCGSKRYIDNGNDSLMRILPIAFVQHTGIDIGNVSSLTHSHKISVSACMIYIEIAEMLIQGKGISDIISMLENAKGSLREEFDRLYSITELTRYEIKSSGYVVDTLEAALWSFLTTNTYRDCVLAAVNLGEDTDTIAAVAGGLAGIYYGCGGESGIPDEWIAQIPRHEWIEDLCKQLVLK